MTSATAVGREPVIIVEIDQDRCGNTFGVSPCAASGTPCFNTYATCAAKSAYALGAPLTLRFCQNNAGQSYDGYYLIPLLEDVDITPTKLNPGGVDSNATAFGERASVNVTLQDAPHTDNLTDPYLSTRNYNPLTRSTFWRKWLQRNPYHQGRPLRIREGYFGQAWVDMVVRHYLIEGISITESGVTIDAKDPLALTDDDVSVAPKPTGATLVGDVDDAQTSFTMFGVADAVVPSAGWVRIGSEIVHYATRNSIDSNGRITITNITRGAHGTKAESHQDKDTVQVCINYQNWLPWLVVRDLLISYASIPASYIDDGEWNTEGNDWLSQFTVSCILSEPEGVGKLIAEICQQVLMYIWYDDRARKIKMRAIRPYDGVSIPLLNDDSHLIAGSVGVSIDSSSRVTQVWMHHKQRNAAESPTESKNYDAHYVRVDTSSESVFENNGVQITHIYARWLETDAQVRSVASRYLARYRNAPMKLTIKVDAKDRDAVSTGAVVDVSTGYIVDEFGAVRTQRFEVLSVDDEQLGEVAQVELQTAAYDAGAVQRNAYIMGSSAPDYSAATTAQKTKGCWIANSAGKLPGGDDAYYII